jgi:hypothetical protein
VNVSQSIQSIAYSATVHKDSVRLFRRLEKFVDQHKIVCLKRKDI